MNAIHFKDPIDILFEFIPQILFFMSTFGYMCFAIIVKWLTNYDESPYPPPSILNIYTGGGFTVTKNC
jgi:V-type H+-transporting ATPase subunit a